MDWLSWTKWRGKAFCGNSSPIPRNWIKTAKKYEKSTLHSVQIIITLASTSCLSKLKACHLPPPKTYSSSSMNSTHRSSSSILVLVARCRCWCRCGWRWRWRSCACGQVGWTYLHVPKAPCSFWGMMYTCLNSLVWYCYEVRYSIEQRISEC